LSVVLALLRFLILPQFHNLVEDHNKAVLVYCADDDDGPLPMNNSHGIVMIRSKRKVLQTELLKAAGQIVTDHMALAIPKTNVLRDNNVLRKDNKDLKEKNAALAAELAAYKANGQNSASDDAGHRRTLQSSQVLEGGRKQAKKRSTKK
jgi:hypothetical protein